MIGQQDRLALRWFGWRPAAARLSSRCQANLTVGAAAEIRCPTVSIVDVASSVMPVMPPWTVLLSQGVDAQKWVAVSGSPTATAALAWRPVQVG
jgi:hypothetical protein